MKLDLLGSERRTRPAPPPLQWQSLLVKRSLLGLQSTARPAPTPQQSRNMLVKLGLLEPQSSASTTEAETTVSSGEAGSGEEDMTDDATTAVAKSAGEARPLGIANHTAQLKIISSRTSSDSWNIVEISEDPGFCLTRTDVNTHVIRCGTRDERVGGASDPAPRCFLRRQDAKDDTSDRNDETRASMIGDANTIADPLISPSQHQCESVHVLDTAIRG